MSKPDPELKLPSDFAVKIAKTLNCKVAQVNETFEFEEDRTGFFWARLKAKKFLDKLEFKAVCALVRDLGGEDYLEGAKAWKIPGPYAKTGQPSEGHVEEASKGVSKPTSKQLEGHKLELEKGTISSIRFEFLPVKVLLSMPFQTRTATEDPELADLVESVKAYGILEPIVVRQKPNGLYEVVMGDRRVKSAQKAGLIQVPAIIRAMSDEEASICQLIENIHRKDLSDQEKSRALAQFAKTRNWNAKQIADHIKMSERWVYKYLPEEFKKSEPEQLAKGREESQESIDSARRALSSESQEPLQGPKTIPCDHCGEPTSHPIHTADNKNYCSQECLEQGKAESLPSALHEESNSSEETRKGPGELETPPKKSKEPEPLLSGFQVECPQCHKALLVEHRDFPDNHHDHKVREVGTA